MGLLQLLGQTLFELWKKNVSTRSDTTRRYGLWKPVGSRHPRWLFVDWLIS